MIQNSCSYHFLAPVTSSPKSIMITPKICHFLVKGSTIVTFTYCRFGNMLISKVPSSFLISNQIFPLIKIKLMPSNQNLSFWNLLWSIRTKCFMLLSSSFQKTCHFISIHLSFCGQDLTSRHITDSTNFKNTMQQGGIETICIPRNQINTALDLPV